MDVEWQEALVWAVTIATIGMLLAVTVRSIMHVGQTDVASKTSVEFQESMHALAEQATAAQRTTASELTEIRLAMAELRDRLAAVERMMAEVG